MYLEKLKMIKKIFDISKTETFVVGIILTKYSSIVKKQKQNKQI